MGIRVDVFRGQGVRIGKNRYGVVHSFVSPTEVLVRFKEGFETVTLDQLLPVVALTGVAERFEEHEIELELPGRTETGDRDTELEPDLSG